MFFPDSFPFPRLRKYEEFLKDTMTLSRKYQRRVELSIRRAFVSLTGGGGEFPTYFPTFPLSHFPTLPFRTLVVRVLCHWEVFLVVVVVVVVSSSSSTSTSSWSMTSLSLAVSAMAMRVFSSAVILSSPEFFA